MKYTAILIGVKWYFSHKRKKVLQHSTTWMKTLKHYANEMS